MTTNKTEIRTAIAKRWQKAQALMKDHGIDLLMITDDHNDFYFTNNKMSSTWKGRSRPLFFFLPAEGQPVSLLHEFKVGAAKGVSVVNDLRSHKQLDYSPVQEVAEIVKDLCTGKMTVGVELGHEQWMGMPVGHYEELKRELADVTFVDATALLWQLRIIKDELEIDSLRQACTVHGRAYDKLFTIIEPGMSEKDVFRKMGAAVFEEGGDQLGFFIISSGMGNYEKISGMPTDRKIEPGDMIWIDSGVEVNRYNSDFSRAGVIGGPTSKQEEMQKAIHELTLKTIDTIRAGVTASHVARVCEKEANKSNLGISFSAGRIGHGVGLMVTEPPSIALYDDTVLETGMVLAIEPGKVTQEGIFHVEENVLVTDRGAERLTSCDRHLRSI